jgi:hypothetical protein
MEKIGVENLNEMIVNKGIWLRERSKARTRSQPPGEFRREFIKKGLAGERRKRPASPNPSGPSPMGFKSNSLL